MKLTTRFITRTALGITLVLTIQLIGKQLPVMAVIYGPFSIQQLITGSLVNCTIIAFSLIQIWQSEVVIGVISAFMAAILAILSVPLTSVAIAIGNGLIAYLAVLLITKYKLNSVISIITSSVIKCGFLWISVPFILNP